MRTFTGAQAVRFASGQFAVAYKVEIDRTGAGTWVDVTNMHGRDWVREFSVKDSIDDPSITASLKLVRSQYFLSLSPLMTTSQLNAGGPLVTVAKMMRIWVYYAPYGKASAVPPSGWVLLFKGRIYSVDWAGDEIAVEARDLGGDMMDSFITEKANYGSDAGVLAESVMQSIIAARATGTSNTLPTPATAYTLYSANGTLATPWNPADSPGWAIHVFPQDMMPLYSAVSLLAQQIGWLLKFRYSASAADFVLTWFDPVRSNTTPAYTFKPSNYYSLNECSLHLGDIRNMVRVQYTDINRRVQTYPAADPISMAMYGNFFRFMGITEESTSQINTSTEAAKMASGAVSDLAQPNMTHAVEMPLFWPAQICDVYLFKANYVHYDSDQTLAVTGFEHSVAPDKASTVITLRGKPSAGIKTWFERQATGVRKQFGLENWQVDADDTNQTPNGVFTQYSKG